MTSAPMPAHRVGVFERLLREQLVETDAAIGESDDSLGEVRSAKSDGTADDEHDPDGTTLTAEWSRISGLHDELVGKRAAIEAALERIVAGDYGRCIRCGRTIAVERLRARPATPHCIDCARELEGRR